MQEKDMVSDILSGTKASIDSYTKAITECANQQLRSTLQQLRNEAEQFQYQLFQIAEQKGYYTPAPPANSNDIQQVKSGLTGVGMTMR
jgi:spore coat protein CotF